MLKSNIQRCFIGICSATRSPSRTGRCVLPVLILSFTLFITPAFAKLKPLGESELKSTTAQQGFTQFAMSNNTARMFLDIHMETYTTIDALSGGYYIKDSGSGPALGWDQQWSNIAIGNSVDDTMDVDGLVLMADFNDDNRLQRLVLGSNRLQGDLSASFTRYSGTYNNALVGGNWEAVDLNRQPVIPTTFNFDSDGYQEKNMGLYFVLNMEGPHQGLQVVAGFDEQSLTPGQWWDNP
ncbi:hypothetical protein [Desulfoluna sp.]|uniref:hypothetical protein n=1 Tax=Desulfoluna sp. TaxID=2045199 RepID=UPI002614B182|nr:hypothetical protein [Desulfoluna sp.]